MSTVRTLAELWQPIRQADRVECSCSIHFNGDVLRDVASPPIQVSIGHGRDERYWGRRPFAKALKEALQQGNRLTQGLVGMGPATIIFYDFLESTGQDHLRNLWRRNPGSVLSRYGWPLPAIQPTQVVCGYCNHHWVVRRQFPLEGQEKQVCSKCNSCFVFVHQWFALDHDRIPSVVVS